MSSNQKSSPNIIKETYCPECGSNIINSAEDNDNKQSLCVICFRHYRPMY